MEFLFPKKVYDHNSSKNFDFSSKTLVNELSNTLL